MKNTAMYYASLVKIDSSSKLLRIFFNIMKAEIFQRKVYLQKKQHANTQIYF